MPRRMPGRSILRLVPGTNIVSPPGRLHKQHKAMISNGNVLKSRLPLVGIPRMFLQRRFYLLDSWRVLLLEDLVSDDSREQVAGDVPRNGGAGKRHDGG